MNSNIFDNIFCIFDSEEIIEQVYPDEDFNNIIIESSVCGINMRRIIPRRLLKPVFNTKNFHMESMNKLRERLIRGNPIKWKLKHRILKGMRARDSWSWKGVTRIIKLLEDYFESEFTEYQPSSLRDDDLYIHWKRYIGRYNWLKSQSCWYKLFES